MNGLMTRLREASSLGGYGIIIVGAGMIAEDQLYVGIAVIVMGIAAVVRKEMGSSP